MATLTVRNIDDDLKQRLRVQAAQHGRSMEAEVREILRESVLRADAGKMGETAAEFFERIRKQHPIDEDDDFNLMDHIPPREMPREPPRFD